MKPRPFALPLAALGLVFVLALLIAPVIGSTSISLSRAFAGESPDADIFFGARLPRVLMAGLTGIALSVAGVVLQSLLRDALATPYTLGISSGASLGAVVALAFGWRLAGQLPAVWVAAFAGAALTLLLVLSIATEGRRISSFTLLLTGVTINSICLALILFIQNITTYGRALTILRWLMGGIEPESYSTIAALALVLLIPCVAVLARAREWNLLAVGEDWAVARGVNAQRAILTGYFATSVLTGATTAFTGPIGFVGLIVPHALRLLLGADHRLLLPASALGGGAFLILCDALARTVLAPTEIPVGVVTAMLGGPFFIWLLKSKRRSLWL